MSLGFKRLRPWIFLTFRHYKGGRSSAISTGRLYLRRNPLYSLSEAESTSGHMVLPGVTQKKSPVTPPGIDPRTVRLAAQHLNHYATPGPGRTHTYRTEVGADLVYRNSPTSGGKKCGISANKFRYATDKGRGHKVKITPCISLVTYTVNNFVQIG